MSRHSAALRPDIVEVAIEIIKSLRSLGGEKGAEPMETELAAGPSTIAPSAGDAAASAAEPSAQSDSQTFLVEGVAYTARMLETLFSHGDTAKLFMEKGIVEMLLALHRLPALPSSFGSTNASHALLSAFRAMLPHAAGLSTSLFAPVRAELAAALDSAIGAASALRGSQVLELPPESRESYIRTLTRAEGMTSFAAAAVRSLGALVGEYADVGKGSIIAKLGVLERLVLVQAALADELKLAADLEEKAKAKVAAGQPEQPAIARAQAGGSSSAAAPEAPAAMDVEPATEEDKKKKTDTLLVRDILRHSLHACHAFYQSVSKVIHTSSRRRESVRLTPGMRAAALELATTLHLTLRQAHESAAASSPSPEGVEYPPEGMRLSRYLMRALNGLFGALFDTRRNTCHCLVLNFFVSCGGLVAFLQRFQDVVSLVKSLPGLDDAAVAKLFKLLAEGERSGSDSDDAVPDSAAMAHHFHVEAVAGKFLETMASLSFAHMLASSPNAGALLTAEVPSAGSVAVPVMFPPATDVISFVRTLWGVLLGAVLPVWQDTALLTGHPWLVQDVVSVMHNCTESEASVRMLTALSGSRAAGQTAVRRTPSADPERVQIIVGMGFTEAQAREAMRRVRSATHQLAWRQFFIRFFSSCSPQFRNPNY